MLFSRSGRSIFPLLPPYAAHAPNPNQGHIIALPPDGLTPYLGLRARLSQVWINRWTILLLLVLVRVLLAASGLQADMSTAKREALSACTSVESMGSSMASMPHYLSQGVNELTATGVEKAVSGLKSMLMLTITGVEELVLFIIKVLYQTYLCLFTLAVRGSVHVAVGVIKEAADFLNSTVKEVGDDIGKAVSTFESAFNKFLDGVNTVASAFGASVPTLTSTARSALWRTFSCLLQLIKGLTSSIVPFRPSMKSIISHKRSCAHLLKRSKSSSMNLSEHTLSIDLCYRFQQRNS